MLITGAKSISGSPRSILLIQLGDIGDVVLSLPCIRALRETYPQARIVAAVWDKAAELLEDCPWLDQVLAVRRPSSSLRQELVRQYDFFRSLRRLRCDLAVDLRTGTRGAIMAFLAGARQRIAFYADDGTLWRNRLFTSLVHREYTPDLRVSEYLLSLLEAFGISTPHRTPELAGRGKEKQPGVPPAGAGGALSGEKRIVAVQPFSLWQYKEWGKEKYIALIRWLIAEQEALVLVTGSAAEQERAEEIVRSCGERCLNYAGKTSIGGYATLLRECRLFIGVDSAGLHIAAAVGTPTVAIFGPSSPVSWAPVGGQHLVVRKDFPCLPCRQKGCDNREQSRCLDELTVQEVVAPLSAHLKAIGLA